MRCKGFTLVELLTALALVTILLSIGLPAFGRLIDNQRMDVGKEQLARSIQQTREEAVRRNEAVTMAPVDGDWNAGWRIFIDRNSNTLFDQGDQLLGQDMAASVHHIHGSGALARYLRYNALGESELVNGGFLAGTLRLCPHQQGDDARLLIINRVGRLRLDREPAQPRYCPASLAH
ncbi:type IV fimbrial biogenesis protein FimT [Halopseudomonas sabulinigri]|uniref:Type II secretion system protein H n=1 Tax=Halopseudomonas sabulinigri TaxID=472181 RepID=A0A1H1R2W6_9GAMM|nr:GspH/FimT family pseudopilin [Halopseudomonas sabulinigri]SDS30012.1 type IV fimbrial biogenesis protein FimT [Halopseudomonas sabulinigri]